MVKPIIQNSSLGARGEIALNWLTHNLKDKKLNIY